MRVISLIFLAVCVMLATANKGFQDAKEGQFPYQVSLRSKTTRKHYCGGAILNSRFILTAAHCISRYGTDRGLKNMHAVVGAQRNDKGGVSIAVDNAMLYWQYHNTYDFCQGKQEFGQYTYDLDLALIRTAEPIKFTDTVQPIALPTRNTVMKENVTAVVSGWESGKKATNTLRFMKTHTMDHNICYERVNEMFPYFEGFRGTNMCTNMDHSAALNEGFEGGPLVDMTNPEKKELMGIVSFGIPCKTNYPEIYTRVFPFVDWIKESMEVMNNKLQ